MDNNLNQYSYYSRFCRVGKSNDLLIKSFKEVRSEVSDMAFPKLDFSKTGAFSAFRMTLKTPIVSPYLSHELVADLLDIDLSVYENIIGGRAVVCFAECIKGRYRTGDVIMRNNLLKNELCSGNFLYTGYAIAFLLYLRDYYRKDVDGDYLIGNENVSPRTQKALQLLEEYNLNATDVFVQDLIGPKELTTTFQTRGVDGSVELKFLANTYHSLYCAIERVNALQKRNSAILYLAHSSALQKRVENLFSELIEAGMVFKNYYEIKTDTDE